MMKKVLFLIAIFSQMVTFVTAEIISTNRFDEILTEIDSCDTLVLVDMDDTITDSSLSLGSGAWRRHIRKKIPEYEKEFGKKLDCDLHDLLTVFVACKVPVKPVEACIPHTIQTLQLQGIPVLLYTARGKSLWYSTPMPLINALTRVQLLSVGCDFSQTIVPKLLQKLDSQFIEDGEIYTTSIDKGLFLRKMLTETGYRPTKIVCIDDKKEQLVSLEKETTDFKIPFVGFWYTRAEREQAHFDHNIATYQLIELLNNQKIVKDQEVSINEFDDSDMNFKCLIDQLDIDQLQKLCHTLLQKLREDDPEKFKRSHIG